MIKWEWFNKADYNRKEGLLSYSQWKFHRASWASRHHTAMCWCTSGSGRRLWACSCALCGVRISTPPSPPSFYFDSSKNREGNKKEGDWWERQHHSSQRGKWISTFLFQWWSEAEAERDGHRLSLWPQLILLCRSDFCTLVKLSKELSGKRGNKAPLFWKLMKSGPL